jgi:cation:H+ antiporter
MANLGLILAVAALVGRCAVPQGILRRELPLTLAATALFALLVQGGLSRVEGTIRFLVLVVVLWRVITARPTIDEDDDESSELATEVDEFLVDEQAEPSSRLVAIAAAGLVGTLIGAQLLVSGAVEIASRLDLSGGFVGLTVVALGTSLPELVTALAAARRGEDQLILGNVLGSNLFNSLAVSAVIGLVGPGAITDAGVTVLAVGLMLAITALAAMAMTRRRLVTRGEAVTLLAGYCVCMPLLAL